MLAAADRHVGQRRWRREKLCRIRGKWGKNAVRFQRPLISLAVCSAWKLVKISRSCSLHGTALEWRAHAFAIFLSSSRKYGRSCVCMKRVLAVPLFHGSGYRGRDPENRSAQCRSSPSLSGAAGSVTHGASRGPRTGPRASRTLHTMQTRAALGSSSPPPRCWGPNSRLRGDTLTPPLSDRVSVTHLSSLSLHVHICKMIK